MSDCSFLCRSSGKKRVPCLTASPLSVHRGKSQSVETGSGQPRLAAGGRQASTAGAGMAAPGPGLAQRSLDSVWPPALSRGECRSAGPEEPLCSGEREEGRCAGGFVGVPLGALGRLSQQPGLVGQCLPMLAPMACGQSTWL